MKKVRTHLLATAAIIGLGGSVAYAADMGLPTKAPAPPPIPYVSWQGWYVGALIGAARLNETATNFHDGAVDEQSVCGSQYNTGSCATSATGLVAGAEIGYDWQDRYFVYGLAADWTWTGLKHTQNHTSGISVWSHQAKVDWLASFRGRMGLAVDTTLVYFTGGLALGGVKSSAQFSAGEGVEVDWGHLNKTAVGWVAGLGVEHKFNQNWSVKAEALYYDLGRSTATGGPAHSGTPYSTEFTHEVIVGRVGLAYHF